MQHVGWRFNLTRSDAREGLLAELRGMVCHALNLCTSVACQCVTGVGEKVCAEHEIGGAYPVYHSQGPDWSVTIVALENTLLLNVYFGGPVLGIEMRDLHQAFVQFDLPLFQSATFGSYL